MSYFQELREKLASVETYDSTNILAALRGVINYVQEQWTNSVPINILLVTDEGDFIRKKYVGQACENFCVFPVFDEIYKILQL